MMKRRKRTSLYDMADAARSEARRIHIVQQKLVADGDLPSPSLTMVKRAEAFEDIADLMETIAEVPKEQMAKLLAPIAARRRAAEEDRAAAASVPQQHPEETQEEE